jgi:putative peptidoglycan lipid II flippase
VSDRPGSGRPPDRRTPGAGPGRPGVSGAGRGPDPARIARPGPGARPGPARGTSPRDRAWQPRGTFRVSPEAVGGDAILSGEATNPATPDLSVAAAARLGGRAIALAGVVVVAGVVLSRLLGWIRLAVFAAEFGSSSSGLDAFLAAFRIPDTLFQLVAAGALGSALVPVVSALLANGEAQRARRVVSTIANLMIITLIPLTILVWLAAPVIVPVIFPDPNPSTVGLEIDLTRWMLLSPILLALAASMTAGLNAVGVFGAPALAPNVYNVAIIGCALILTPLMGVYALALGVVLGAAGHVGTQALAVRRNGLYSLVVDLKDPAVKETLLLMAPRALGLGATQIVFLVNTYFAVQLGSGSNTIYMLAFTALQIPVGLIGVPLGIVLLPPLSQAIARNDTERFRRLVDQSLRLLLFVVVPLTGVMLVLATPTLAFLFQHGAFAASGTTAMVPVFVVFLVGLVAHVLIALLAPIFYAGKDTRTPVTAALVAVAVDVVSAALLFPMFHLEGLALAIGLGAWVEVSMLFYFMRRRIGFDLRPIGLTVAFAIPGASLAAAAALGMDRVIGSLSHGSGALPVLVIDLALASLAGLGVYLVWSRLLRLPELATATELARTLLKRG